MNTDDVLTHSSGVEKAKEERDGWMDLTDTAGFLDGKHRGHRGAEEGGPVWAARQRATTIVKEEGKEGLWRGGSSEGGSFLS